MLVWLAYSKACEQSIRLARLSRRPPTTVNSKGLSTRSARPSSGQLRVDHQEPRCGGARTAACSSPGKRVARSAQVKRYLTRYGKVLVCTYRDFLILRLDSNGQVQAGERFTLAPAEDSF
jgi:hypothetical protein